MTDGEEKPVALAPYEVVDLSTKSFKMNFEVGDDGRLYQRPIGTSEGAKKTLRTDEAYPQAGDGYVFQSVLQAIHGRVIINSQLKAALN